MPSVHNNGSGSSEPDPQVALNTAAILQNELIAKMDTLQAGETIAEAGEIHAYGGRQWISVVDNAEVPDPVSIAALEASSDFNPIPTIDQLNCLPQTTLTPAADWTLTGGMQANGANLLIGGAGQQDGVAEYDYTVPVGNRSTKHVFGFTLREVDAAGNDIALRVEIEQAGSVFASRDVLTTEIAQSITLDFVPTADVKIRIRDTSTGSQGSNRDALVSAMQLEATCEALKPVNPIHPDAGYALCSAEAPFLQNPSGSGVILFEEFTETFTPHANGEYTFTYSASEIVRLGGSTNGTAAVNIGTTLGASDIFDSAATLAARLNTGTLELEVTITLEEGVEYFFTGFAGGGSNVTGLKFCIVEQRLADYIDEQGIEPTLIPTTGTNPAARLEITNNTLQSELSLVLGDLGISVDGVAIMPMTSADYTQGGITAVTADSTNWTRASTGNGPTDTNVGFENVPQGRYRYTFSIPEQEDGSTVDANDVADNDRPFPIILVDGVPAKLHADNTYIEHDDGSTSEYHSSGTIVVPEGGSVQLGLVIEGGNTEEFEFQSAVITTEQGADAIYGFFEIEKIDRPVVVPSVNEVTQQLAALQNQFDIDSTVLTTIPDLQFDVKSGEKWVFEVNLLANSLDAASDLRAGTIAPAGSTGRFTFVNAENATVRGADINAATLALVVATGTDDLIQIKGVVNAGEDGVVQFQLRNNTGTVLQSFRPDSWVEAKKISLS